VIPLELHEVKVVVDLEKWIELLLTSKDLELELVLFPWVLAKAALFSQDERRVKKQYPRSWSDKRRFRKTYFLSVLPLH
jgi:hypothetical protein